MNMGLSEEPKAVDEQKAEAKKAMEGWAQKVRGVLDAKTDYVNLSADGMILEVFFKEGPYIRVVYGEQERMSEKPFSYYRLNSKDEFYALDPYETISAKSAEEIDEILSSSDILKG